MIYNQIQGLTAVGTARTCQVTESVFKVVTSIGGSFNNALDLGGRVLDPFLQLLVDLSWQVERLKFERESYLALWLVEVALDLGHHVAFNAPQ